MPTKPHEYRVGTHAASFDSIPSNAADLDTFIQSARKRIEPWLSAVFQAEHLNALIGSGFTTGIAAIAGKPPAGMGPKDFGSTYGKQINAHATLMAKKMNRGAANIEDQFRSALALAAGLAISDPPAAKALYKVIAQCLADFLKAILKTEEDIRAASPDVVKKNVEAGLQSFLLSFASRAASRERLHVFTTNYDRLIEHGCDLAGLRSVDRFVGALRPVFRASRVEVDLHYNPPGIRGEPRYMEGVIKLTKLHGSIDWVFNEDERSLFRSGLPFGAPSNHTDVPTDAASTIMIYPNAAKDTETTEYPYAELFRDFAAAICRPNAVVVTYGYGFGDDHINRVLLDMLTIPSTHLVIISYENDDRLKAFCAETRVAQVSLLIGSHFADLSTLVDNYLPKPALDYITGRMTELMKHRPPDPSAATTSTPPAAPSGAF
jgi:hypothetical protein